MEKDKTALKMTGLFTVAEGIFNAVLAKSDEEDVIDVISRHIAKEISDITEEEAASSGKTILGSIDKLSQSFINLEKACEGGMTREEYLEKLLTELDGQTVAERGECLAQIRKQMAEGNAVLYDILKVNGGESFIPMEEAEAAGLALCYENWDENSLKKEAQAIRRESEAATMGILSLPLGAIGKYTADIASSPEGQSVAEKILGEKGATVLKILDAPTGSASDRALKAVCTGALKIASHKGMVKFLSKKTPIAALAGIAHWGVEGTRTAYLVGAGKITKLQGVERMLRVSASTTSTLLKEAVVVPLALIPGVGVGVSLIAGNLLDNSEYGQKVDNLVYAGFDKLKDTVISLYEGNTAKGKEYAKLKARQKEMA